MAQISHFPHIKNVKAGINYWDPMQASIFEVSFTLPDAIASKYASDLEILSSQVTQVTGLDALQKSVAAGEQKFYGASASFLNPTLDNTYADLTIEFNLNLRNVTDAYVFNVFNDWRKLGYDLATGSRNLMADYIAKNLNISEANRNGVIWRSYTFHKVMLTGMTGIDSLNYTDNEARKLTCTFRSDWWDEA